MGKIKDRSVIEFLFLLLFEMKQIHDELFESIRTLHPQLIYFEDDSRQELPKNAAINSIRKWPRSC